MDLMLFHTSLRNAGLFLTLSFSSFVYFKNNVSKRKHILFLTIFFNLISLNITYEIMKENKTAIPKYVLICNLFLMGLIFKNFLM